MDQTSQIPLSAHNIERSVCLISFTNLRSRDVVPDYASHFVRQYAPDANLHVDHSKAIPRLSRAASTHSPDSGSTWLALAPSAYSVLCQSLSDIDYLALVVGTGKAKPKAKRETSAIHRLVQVRRA
ncbi:hypothetical protein MANI_018818 [Metarhizium anisopliae]|nr:hypothetical protein MANI_018818 [Metarhizium anisopliae]